jgi:translation initiation factor IF-2
MSRDWNLEGRRTAGQNGNTPRTMQRAQKPRTTDQVVNLFKSNQERTSWAAGRSTPKPGNGMDTNWTNAEDSTPFKIEYNQSSNLVKADYQPDGGRDRGRREPQTRPASDSAGSRLRERLSQIEDRQSGRRRGGAGEGASKNLSRGRRDEDQNSRGFDAATAKKRKEERRRAKDAAKNALPEIRLPSHISVSNLATILRYRFKPFTDRLIKLGFQELEHYHVLTAEDAALVAMEFGFKPIIETSSKNLVAAPLPKDMSSVPLRPPVVTIMGHVDHGKTTILDFLRKSSIAAGEAGGITQHIGAFSVPMSTGRTITFLDTPGHAAFLTMRERGANVTDIIVLVVAADDGVMPQTIEAIKHAKSAKVPLIVALSKIDRPEADPLRAKQAIARHGVEIEEYGGDTPLVEVSGKTGQGIPDLEESIITLSEILDHRSPPDGKVEGWVLESTTKEGMGRVATVLLRRGTLKSGDILVAGCAWTRVRTLRNEAGASIDSAGPGQPVVIDGWKETPSPGDECLQAVDEQEAGAVVRTRADLESQVRLAADMQAVNERRKVHDQIRAEDLKGLSKKDLSLRSRRLGLIEGSLIDQSITLARSSVEEDADDEKVKNLNFVIKADVIGSVEAVINLISSMGNQFVNINIVRSTTGPLSKADVDMAHASDATILAFNADVPADAHRLAEDLNIDVWQHDVIYRIPEDITKKIDSVMPRIVTQRVSGEAEIAAVFDISVKVGTEKVQRTVAGCKVRNGLVKKGSKVRVIRGGETIYDGKTTSIRSNTSNICRYTLIAAQRKEGRVGDEKGYRMWYGFRRMGRVPGWRQDSNIHRDNGAKKALKRISSLLDMDIGI